MTPHRRTPRGISRAWFLVLALVLAVPVAAPAVDRSYQVHYLVSDGFVPADHTDPNLVNAWGVAFNPFAFVWVADNATGVATLYDGNGVPQSLVVTIPGGSPTGIVFNGSTTDFVVHQGTLSGAAAFLFATEKGVIAGWSPGVNRTNAIVAADSSASGAIYKGLALAGTGNGFQLYATDFHNGKIDVFDSAFHPVTAPGGFTDPTIPRNFAPFGIQNLNGNIYVTYAKQDDEREDDVHGPGLGFVNVFDPNGNLIRRVASRGTLNAPWGLALAPADFGAFSNQLLVGNFGDGTISAYDERSGKFTGQLLAPNSRPLVIDGLWGLSFGNGVLNQPTNTLFFAAGPDDENHGAYGRIEPTVR